MLSGPPVVCCQNVNHPLVRALDDSLTGGDIASRRCGYFLYFSYDMTQPQHAAHIQGGSAFDAPLLMTSIKHGFRA